MTKEIKYAIIGTGFMGKAHMTGYQTLPLFYNLDFKAVPVGICSKNLENAKRFKEDFNFEFATDNEDEIFARKDIDVVHICTPNNLHAQEILKALDAKKNIYCEKPLISSAADIAKLAKHKNLEKVTSQVVYHNRFYPAVMRAKELIEAGALGRVLSFRGQMLHDSFVDPNKPATWRHTAAGQGGVIYDLGAHICDMVYFLLGGFESVYASIQTAWPTRKNADGKEVKIEMEDAAYCVVKLKNGAMGTLEATKLATGKPGNPKLEIHGDKGAIIIDLINPNFVEYYDNAAPKTPHGGMRGFTKIQTVQFYDEAAFPPGNHTMGFLRAHTHSLYNFLTCVSNGKQAHPSIKDGLAVQEVLEAIHKSAKEKKEVSL